MKLSTYKTLRKAKQYTGNRAGFSIFAILAVIAVAALLATLLVPRLGNTEIPAIEANLKEDVKNIKGAMEQGSLLTPNKDFTGVTLKFLEDNAVIKGAFAQRVDAAGIYLPSYAPKGVTLAQGASMIVETKADGVDPETMLLSIDFSDLAVDKKDTFGPSFYGWLTKFAGENQIACNAAAATAFTAATAVTSGAATCLAADQKAGKFIVKF